MSYMIQKENLYLKNLKIQPDGTVGSMVLCIHILFQSIFCHHIYNLIITVP
jgi:hypothetical protein